MTLRFDMGGNADDGRHLQSPKAQDTTVNGKPARILTAGPQVMLVIPHVHESGRFTVRFNMSLQFDGELQPTLAQRVFASIEFKPPR